MEKYGATKEEIEKARQAELTEVRTVIKTVELSKNLPGLEKSAHVDRQLEELRAREKALHESLETPTDQ